MPYKGTVELMEEVLESKDRRLNVYLGGIEGIPLFYRVEFDGSDFTNINMEESLLLSIPEWPPTPIKHGFAIEGGSWWFRGDGFRIREAKYLNVTLIRRPDACISFDAIYTNPAGRERVIQNVTKYSWAPTPPPPEEIRRRFEKWLKEPTLANTTDFLGMFDDAKNTIGDTIEDIAPVKPPRPPDLFKK